MTLNFDVIVIGSGAAGMTAAIYLKRANVNVMMLDKNAPGGQINRIAFIENYPGFSNVAGSDLAYNMFMQTQELGVPYKYGNVVSIKDEGDYKVVKTEQEEFTCKSVIIATGRKPKELGLENEKKLIGRGISWCAICDATLFKDKDVVVVGGGNCALIESLYLSDIVNSVTIVHRSSEFRAEKIMQDRIFSNPKIKVHFNSVVTKLNIADNKLEGVQVFNKEEEKESTINAAGLFIFIGFEPSTEYVRDLNIATDNNYIVVDNNMRTDTPGVYACGDVIKKELYQITTSVAEGSIAAMSAVNDLKE
jgi:thioredoxin reductase (NADPH)